METHKKFKVIQCVLKMYIFIVGFGLVIYMGLLCLNVRHIIADLLCMCFGMGLLLLSAWVFKLCKMSVSFILYIFLVRTCIILHRENVFGGYVDIAHYIVFGIGFTLVMIFLLNYKKYICNENDKPTLDSEDAASNSRED